MLRFFLVFLLFFLVSCTKDNTFKMFSNKSEVGKLHSFNLVVTDKSILNIAKKALKEEDIKIQKSPYTMIIESSKYPSHCNNPLTPAYEATYDGYIRISVKKAFNDIYFIQRDFHGDVTQSLIEDLLEELKEDLKYKEK